MNLRELYQATPSSKHGKIKVIGDKVIIYNQNGSQELYLLDDDGEMWPILGQGARTFQIKRPLTLQISSSFTNFQ